jgi:colanic acid biosynthesis glycosyl transferase WcaI
MERKSYVAADHITVMSKMGKELISNRGGNLNKITPVYNSVSLPTIDEYLKKNDFKKKENIEGKTLVSYAGILSSFQGIDDIVDAAKKLKEHDDITFYIIGDGTCKNQLVNRVKDEKIHNVKIMPLQPRDEYFNIINSSDISIVSLDKRMTAPAIPGKLINLLAAKQPIIANVPPTNETALIIKKVKCGIVTEPGNIDEIAKAIIKLKYNPKIRWEMGIRGRQFIEEEINLEKNVVVYEHIFKSIVAQG